MAGPIRIALIANASQARRELRGVESDLQRFGRVARVGAAAGAAALVAGIGKAVSLEAEFSKTINQVGAVANSSGKELKGLSDLALQMGADTTFSASEAASAMLELAKGGITPATIRGGALAGTLQLAAAGGTDMATAATIASNALNTFSLKGQDMSKVAAALAGGANASTASVESLGQALQQVGPGAVNAGLDINETVAALAAFDAAGIKGSDAGTSLKTMLTRLVPSTEKARTAMRDLGLDFTDSQGRFVPLTNVAQQLQDKLGGLSQEQRTQALATIFGSDATRAATVLMNEGSKGIGKYIAATKDRGAAERAANANMKGTAGAIERFTGSVETAGIKFGLLIKPAAISALDAAGSLIENTIVPAFEDLVGWLRDNEDGFRDTASAAQSALLPPLKLVGAALKTVVGIVREAVEAFNALPAPLKELVFSLGAAALIMPRLQRGAAVSGAAIATMGGRMATAGVGAASFVTGIRNAETRAATARNAFVRMGSAARGAAGLGGFAALTAASGTTNDGLKILGTTAGGALLGFSLAGPIGGAIGAGAGALYGLYDATKKTSDGMKEAKPPAETFAATLDEVTGAATRQTRALVLKRLEEDGLVQSSRQLGVETRDIIDAALGERGAIDRVNRAYRGRSDVLSQLNKNRVSKFIRDNSFEFGRERDQVRDSASALTTYAEILRGMPKKVRTKIEALNYDPTQKQLNRILRTVELTPRERKILIREFGTDGASRKVRDLNKQLGNTGRARPNLGPWGLLLQRGVGQGRRTAERGSRDINRQLGRAGRANPFTEFWGQRLGRGVSAGRRTSFRGTNLINRDLARTGRSAPFMQFWNRGLSSGLTAGQRNTRRGTSQIAGVLTSGTARAKPNLRNFTGGVDRGVSDATRRGRSGGQDVAKGMVDPVNRARPNMSGYVGGVGSGVSQARGVGSSGGFGVGSALKSGIIAGFSGTASALAAQARSAVAGAIAAGRAAAQARSPSRKMMKLGRDLGDGLAVGMASKKKRNNNEARKLIRGLLGAAGNDINSLIDRLKAYGKANDRSEKRIRGVIAALRKQGKALVEARNKEQRLEQAVKGASSRLKDAIKVRDDYANSIRSSFVQFGNVTSIEEGHLNSTSSFLDQLRDRAQKAREFASVVEQLRKQGLNQTSLRQILEAGPEAGRAAADAIAAGGKDAVKEVNDLTKDLAAVGGSLGKDMAKEFYQAGVDSRKKLLDGLKDKERLAEKRANQLAASLLRAFRRRLDIGGGGKKGGKGKGKNRGNAAELLLGSQEATKKRAEEYGAVLAKGVQTGFDGSVKVKTQDRALSAKVSAPVAVGALPRTRGMRVEVSVDEVLNAAATGRKIIKFIDAAEDPSFGARRKR